jgi:glycosidase
VINYPFYAACRSFYLSAELDAEIFKDLISERLVAYPYPMVYALYNLLGSHDTPRWLTEAQGDIQKVALSLVFQFCFVGMPAIYYGDETAMEGENPVKARRCMNFSPGEQGQKLLSLYKQLIALRKQNRALSEGDFAWITVPGPLLAFSRRCGNEQILVYINNSSSDVKDVVNQTLNVKLLLTSDADSKNSIEPMGYRVYQQG